MIKLLVAIIGALCVLFIFYVWKAIQIFIRHRKAQRCPVCKQQGFSDRDIRQIPTKDIFECKSVVEKTCRKCGHKWLVERTETLNYQQIEEIDIWQKR